MQNLFEFITFLYDNCVGQDTKSIINTLDDLIPTTMTWDFRTSIPNKATSEEINISPLITYENE